MVNILVLIFVWMSVVQFVGSHMVVCTFDDTLPISLIKNLHKVYNMVI